MKYLYYNGDSFCGDGVKIPDETFGQLLGDKYNLEVNHAWQGGSSNHRIYRTTVDYIMNNQSKLQDTLFLIGWTKPTRFELYDSTHKKYIGIMGQTNVEYRTYKKVGMAFISNLNLSPDFEVSEQFKKEYITKFVDFENMLEDHIKRVYSLECILKANNCKYLFWNAFHDTCILHPDLPDKIQLWNKAVEIFDWENWILPNSSFDEYLEQFPRADVRQEPYDDHPNKLGHQKWFEAVSEKINSMNIL
jgi:hypothetical protein